MPSTKPPMPIPRSVPAAMSGRRLSSTAMRRIPPSFEVQGASARRGRPAWREAEMDGGRNPEEDAEGEDRGQEIEGEILVENPGPYLLAGRFVADGAGGSRGRVEGQKKRSQGEPSESFHVTSPRLR